MLLCETGCLIHAGDELPYLGSVLWMKEEGYAMRSGNKILESLQEYLDVKGAERVGTPCVADTQSQVRESPALGPEAAPRFRSVLGRLMYLAQDRPHLQFAVVRVARGCATPHEIDWWKIKRTVKYFEAHQDFKCHCEATMPMTSLVAFADSDWAGDVERR